MRILVIEDDDEIRNLIEYFLKKEKFEVKTVDDGLNALRVTKLFKPDLIVLDVMLPNLDGVNICNMIKDMPEKYGTPSILMLTAKTEINDVLVGLKSGADDYMKKPFDPRELMLRIKNILKRDKKTENVIHKYKNIEINMEKHVLLEDNKEIELSKKEYDLLVYLLENEGIVLTREKVLDRVWGTGYFSGDRTVDVYIAKLREKVKTIADFIKTVKGVGYKLEERK